MINGFTMAVYDRSPVWAQNALCTWAGKRYLRQRYGGEFDKWARFYADSRDWSESELREYQREQLRTLVAECFDSVPLYADSWRAAGLSPSDLKDVADLARFPTVSKEDLFLAGDAGISTRFAKASLIVNVTGGSTGMALRRYFTAAEAQRHYAAFWDRMRQGVSRGSRYATFQGKEVVPQRQKGPPYWRENRADNQRLYSMRHLSPDKLHLYAESLMNTPFIYYQGYVSIMSVVAEFMADNNMKLPTPPEAIFTTSEQLTRAARELFEETWQTRVWDEYCQSEQCAMIRQCEHGNFHEQMDYAVIEYEPIAHEGDLLLAEMICTGFIPHAAPLVRYRLGDRVLIDEHNACPCGRPGPNIKAIRGRISDYILTPDGRKYPLTM